MNSILRYYVIPWRLLSGMGNWSYAVMSEWIDPRTRQTSPGSSFPEEFTTREAAADHARKQARAWPYRSEACFLTESGEYLPL